MWFEAGTAWSRSAGSQREGCRPWPRHARHEGRGSLVVPRLPLVGSEMAALDPCHHRVRHAHALRFLRHPPGGVPGRARRLERPGRAKAGDMIDQDLVAFVESFELLLTLM